MKEIVELLESIETILIIIELYLIVGITYYVLDDIFGRYKK